MGSVNLAGFLAPAGEELHRADLSCITSWLRKRALAWSVSGQGLPRTEGHQGLLKWLTAKSQISVPPLHVLSIPWPRSWAFLGLQPKSLRCWCHFKPQESVFPSFVLWPSPWILSVALLLFLSSKAQTLPPSFGITGGRRVLPTSYAHRCFSFCAAEAASLQPLMHGGVEFEMSFDWPCLSVFTHCYSWFAGSLAGSSRQKSFSNKEYFPRFFCVTGLMTQGFPLLFFALGPTAMRTGSVAELKTCHLGKAFWPVGSQVLPISDPWWSGYRHRRSCPNFYRGAGDLNPSLQAYVTSNLNHWAVSPAPAHAVSGQWLLLEHLHPFLSTENRLLTASVPVVFFAGRYEEMWRRRNVPRSVCLQQTGSNHSNIWAPGNYPLRNAELCLASSLRGICWDYCWQRSWHKPKLSEAILTSSLCFTRLHVCSCTAFNCMLLVHD